MTLSPIDEPTAPPPLRGPVRASSRWALVGLVVLAEAITLLALGVGGPFVGILVLGGVIFAVLATLSFSAAWLSIVALVPFSQEIRIPGTGSTFQAPTEPMLFLLEGIWILTIIHKSRIDLPRRPFLYALIGLVAIAFATCSYSDFPGETLKASLNQLWYVLFGVLLAGAALRNERDLRRFAAVSCIPAALVSAYFLQNVVRTGLSLKAINAAALPFFAEHGTFAAYLCFALPAAVALAAEARGRRSRVLYGFIAVLVFAAVLFSLTRAAWVAFGGMSAAALFHSLRSGRARVVMAAGLVVAGLVGLGIVLGSRNTLARHAQSIVDVRTDVSNLERINRWAAAIDMFRAHPVGGVGFGAYKHHYREFRRVRLATTDSASKAGAHNIYLSALSETGIVGGVVSLLFLGSVVGLSARILGRNRGSDARSRSIERVAAACMIGLVGYAVHGVFNHYPPTDKWNVPIWTFVGALAVCERLTARKRPEGEVSGHAS